jgi:hypothetical protein
MGFNDFHWKASITERVLIMRTSGRRVVKSY